MGIPHWFESNSPYYLSNFLCLNLLFLILNYSSNFFFLSKFFKFFFLYFFTNIVKNKKIENKIYFKNTIKLMLFKQTSKLLIHRYIYYTISNSNRINMFIYDNKYFYKQQFSYYFFYQTKYNFLVIHNYLIQLLNLNGRFLLVGFNELVINKFIYYSLIFKHWDLKQFKWFFELENLFLKQKKWQIFFLNLIDKFNIYALLIWDEQFFQKYLKTLLYSNFIKLSCVHLFDPKYSTSFEIKVFQKTLLKFFYLNYLFYVSNVSLGFLKERRFKKYISKFISVISIQ